MQWLQANWLMVFTVWGVVNMALSSVASAVPTTTRTGKLLHVLVAIGPLDVMKVIRTIGAATIPPMVGILCLVLLSCASQVGTPAQQADTLAYGAEENACVTDNKTRSDIDACKFAVRARWCGPGGQLAEAGACFFDAGAVVVLEGGSQ